MKTKFFLIASFVALAMTFGSCEKDVIEVSSVDSDMSMIYPKTLTSYTWQVTEMYVQDTTCWSWISVPHLTETRWNFYEDGTGEINAYCHGTVLNGHGIFEWEYSRVKPDTSNQEQTIPDSSIGYLIIRQGTTVNICAIEILCDDSLELSNFIKFERYYN